MQNQKITLKRTKKIILQSTIFKGLDTRDTWHIKIPIPCLFLELSLWYWYLIGRERGLEQRSYDINSVSTTLTPLAVLSVKQLGVEPAAL
jgi:hypothetical protein